MPSQKKTLAPISEWFAGSFRLSVFPTTATAFDASEWWSEVTGEKPRQTTFQAQAASRVDQGLFGGIPNAVLILTSNPLRIDWIYGIQDQFDFTGTDGIKSFTLGSVLEALEVFDQISSKWFSSSSFPAINRLAFGAQ